MLVGETSVWREASRRWIDSYKLTPGRVPGYAVGPRHEADSGTRVNTCFRFNVDYAI